MCFENPSHRLRHRPRGSRPDFAPAGTSASPISFTEISRWCRAYAKTTVSWRRQQAVKSAEPGCGHRSGSCPPWRQTDHIRLNTRIGRMMSAQTTIEENRPSGFSIGAGGGSTRAEIYGDQNQDQLAPRSIVPGGRAHRLHARNTTEDHQQLGEVKPAKARRTPYLSERCRSI